jgi:hypothetical protein
MERLKIAPEYSSKWLEVDRPQALCDNYLESLFEQITTGWTADHTLAGIDEFKHQASNWILSSTLNQLSGFDNFNRLDVIIGCTQFIDNIYMQCQPQVLVGDYRYHDRLGNWGTRPGLLKEGVPLIIAMPFPSTGTVHIDMEDILDEAQDKGISIHVDGAWLTCCRGIDFDLSHPSIRSVGISLSKGLGLGWNRIGLRWHKDAVNDSISIMNDFNMNCRMLTMVGNHVLANVESDYLWKTYSELNAKVCRDFDLTPSNAIHMAYTKDGNFVGLSPLLRYLMK